MTRTLAGGRWKSAWVCFGLTGNDSDLGRWAALDVLRLHGNRIRVLPFDLFALTSLKELSYEPAAVLIPTPEVVVRGWGMVRCYSRRWIDASVSGSLNLGRFALLTVPTEVLLGASLLTRLDLSRNRLRGMLDPALGILTRLTELDVSHNCLVDLPLSLLSLTRLCGGGAAAPGAGPGPGPWATAAAQGQAQGRARPASAGEGWAPADDGGGEAGTVEEHGGLRWQGNKWMSPPEPVRLAGTRAIFDYMRRFAWAARSGRLELPALGLRHVPLQAIYLGTAITVLDLRANRLRAGPPGLGALRCLTALYLDHNRLSFLHPELCGLSTLQALTVRRNWLHVLPHELCAIRSLVTLRYSGNPLGMPPDGTPVRLDALLAQRPLHPPAAGPAPTRPGPACTSESDDWMQQVSLSLSHTHSHSISRLGLSPSGTHG